MKPRSANQSSVATGVTARVRPPSRVSSTFESGVVLCNCSANTGQFGLSGPNFDRGSP